MKSLCSASTLHCAGLILVGLLLAGCSGGSPRPGGGEIPAPPPPPPPPAGNATLVDTLNTLGINTDETPRLDNRGDPYPESYAPLGTVISVRKVADAAEPDGFNYQLGRAEELLVGGLRLYERPGVLTVLDDLPSGTVIGGSTNSQSLFQRTHEQAPWVVERNTGGSSASGPIVVQGTRRDATAGDFSGTGFRDTAVAYYIEHATGGRELRLLVTNAKPPAPSEINIAIPVDPAIFPINDLRVASGDFDGDQKDEIAIVVSKVPEPGVADTPVRLYIVDDATNNFALVRQFNPALDTGLVSPLVTLVVTGARLDHSIDTELVLVVNAEKPGPQRAYSSRYMVLKMKRPALRFCPAARWWRVSTTRIT